MRTLLISGMVLAMTASAAPVASAGGTGPHVTAWALPSASNNLIERNAGGLDTVTAVGITLDSDGRSVSGVPGSTDRIRRTSQANGLRAELLMNNWSNELEDFDPHALHLLLSHPQRIDAVATKAARLVRQDGWDGLNVDFERYQAADGPALVALLEKLRARLPDDASLSIDVSARTSLKGYRQAGYRLGGIADAVDLVQLMTYDQHGPTWSGPGPVGDVRWARSCIDAALERVPRAKLDVGAAGYGYTWPEVGTGHTVTVKQARSLVADDGATAEWDQDAAEWTATLSDGTVMWWSDKDSYDVRFEIAAEMGLHGVAVWRLGSADTFQAPDAP